MSEFVYPNEPLRPAPIPQPPKEGEKPLPPPAHSTWFVHDPAIYHDPQTEDYFLYCTDARILRSKDMITWSSVGKALEEPSKEAQEWTNSKAVWAPDIVKVGDEYRLYCSNSSWGVRKSCIFLAISDKAEGPFEPKDVVFRSSDRLDVNAIDANIVEDVRTGQQYMAYGSFWTGCHIIELDKETGLALNGPDDPGTCIACRPFWADGAIEGPYIIYNEKTDYYYLFVSYASLKSDYNIRVGRSRNVTGPYLDHNGREMTDITDSDATVGYMLACSYRFEGDGGGYMGPGHNSVLHDWDDEWYLVSHVRPYTFSGGGPSSLLVRKIVWSEDGWPMASPEQYTGEKTQPVDRALLAGVYERIKLTPLVPQGILSPVKMRLDENGTGMLADSIHIEWEMDGSDALTVRYSNVTEKYRVLAAWDYEMWCPTIVITGTDQNHICIWGKKHAG